MNTNAVIISVLQTVVAPALNILGQYGIAIAAALFVLWKGWKLFLALVLDYDMGRHTR